MENTAGLSECLNSVTHGFVATLKCRSKITSLLGVRIFLLKTKKRETSLFSLCFSFSLVYSIPVGLFLLPKCFIVHGLFTNLILTAVIHNPQKPIFKAEQKNKKKKSTLPIFSHFMFLC